MAEDYLKCLNKNDITSNFIEKEIASIKSELSQDMKRIKESNDTGISKMQQIKNKFANGKELFNYRFKGIQI